MDDMKAAESLFMRADEEVKTFYDRYPYPPPVSDLDQYRQLWEEGDQAARWSGVQAISFIEALADHQDSIKQANQAVLTQSMHIDLFVEWSSALTLNNERQADFLYERFPAEQKKATEAWLTLEPETNPNAPPSPFAMSEYILDQNKESADLSVEADEMFATATQANRTADNYVLLTVIFATVLFFGGLSGKFKSRTVDLVMLILALVLFTLGLVVMLGFPVY
jgi:hypothetical protein